MHLINIKNKVCFRVNDSSKYGVEVAAGVPELTIGYSASAAEKFSNV